MYRIADDPEPSKLSKLAVGPFFPLLAAMLAGQWLAWPWFIFNSFAMGSPTKKKELAVVGIAVVGSIIGAFIVVAIPDDNEAQWRLALLGLTTWKLGCAYVLHGLQSRTWQIFVHYEGNAQGKNAFLAVSIGAFFVRPFLFGLVDSLFLKLIIAGGIG